MPITAALVYAGHNFLRYLITATGIEVGAQTMIITTTGAASPDLRTDSLQGPIKQASLAVLQGVGDVPAGPLTQAQARDLWLSDSSGSDIGNDDVPRSIARLARRTGADGYVDANVDGGGNPTVEVTLAEIGTTYLDIECPGAIGA